MMKRLNAQVFGFLSGIRLVDLIGHGAECGAEAISRRA
jgi:hypothetical protein